MIHLMSQKTAEQQGLPASSTHCISPYLNPAHVLSPPRHWLEGLINGDTPWAFFRLRYKNLLRKRYQAEPSRFHALLDASQGEDAITLTCHCLTDHCHRELARDFLEHLREQRAAESRAASPPARKLPPARQWAHKRNPGLGLALLIEHPHHPSALPS